MKLIYYSFAIVCVITLLISVKAKKKASFLSLSEDTVNVDSSEQKKQESFKVLFMYKKKSLRHDPKNSLLRFDYKNLLFGPYEMVFYTSPFPNVPVTSLLFRMKIVYMIQQATFSLSFIVIFSFLA